MNRYEEIIGLPHHQSEKHPHMPVRDRAAQFMPFASLTGYEAVIEEAGRLTDQRTELDESVLLEISDVLSEIQRRIREQPEIQGFSFVPDERKEGGAVCAFSGKAKKIDPVSGTLTLTDGNVLLFSDLIELTLA